MGAVARRILLLGGTGFIGINLARRLRAGGHHVIVTGRDGLPIGEAAAFAVAEGLDTVVHLASALIPSSTEAAYREERVRIGEPTERLAAGLAGTGVRLVFLSSGGTIYGVTDRPFAREDDPCAPISWYGRAKLEAEEAIRAAPGLRHLIARPSNPYGPHQRLGGAQGLVSAILGRLSEGRPLPVWGDGSSVRDYLHIDDLADTLAGLIERGVEGTTINLGSGTGHSLLEVVRTVEQVTGRAVALDFQPARAVDVPRLVLDVSRLRALGLHRARPLHEGVRDYAGALGMALAPPQSSGEAAP
jgi:UDP-glucose 4-epimerase